jgi:hypothetical protein
LLKPKFIIEAILPHVAVQFPIRSFFLERLFALLLFKTFPFKFIAFLLRHLHFLDFGSFLLFNPLVLDSSTFVLEFGDRKPDIKLNSILLIDIAER